jgi:hypothetical protein
MKQNSNQMEQHTNNFGAKKTESGQSKNGTSPKNLCKKAFLTVALSIVTIITCFAQQSYLYGFDYKSVETNVDGKYAVVITGVQKDFPAYNADLRINDVILAIDGKPVRNDDIMLENKPSTVLSIKRLGNQTLDIKVDGLLVHANKWNTEYSYRYDYNSKDKYPINLVENYNLWEYSNRKNLFISLDPEVDLYSYKTFDFEYSENTTIYEKEIAFILQQMLIDKGLARDKDNPDILIFVDYQSEREEQYVPPSQQIHTRYTTSYNYTTKKLEPQQFIESSTTGNYTKTRYLTSLSVAMADAQKIREGSKTFPMIWQVEYFDKFYDKADYKIIAKIIGGKALSEFPLRGIISIILSYWYTGIIYNADIPGLVAGVVPNSPADKAGIKTGDKILETLTASGKSNVMFKNTWEKLKAMLERYGSKIRSQLYTNPEIDNSKGIIFTIQRADKSKAKITVYPKKITYELVN